MLSDINQRWWIALRRRNSSRKKLELNLYYNNIGKLNRLLEDFVTFMVLHTRKSPTKTHVRLQRVNSTRVSHIFHFAKHDFVPTFHVLRDLRAANIVLGLQWLDDEQAILNVVLIGFLH
jgi:hypothetical protein